MTHGQARGHCPVVPSHHESPTLLQGGTVTWPEPISQALARPGGARFYRCAFQVNPFAYFARHGKTAPVADEAAYNTTIVEACQAEGVEVIAVTDHYRIQTAVSLIEAARAAGITVFPAFEAMTKDSVHFLCLFDPTKRVAEIERILGDCGVHDDSEASPAGKYTAEEFLAESRKWGAVCVAAHVGSKNGLLKVLSGPARIGAWKAEALQACCLPGAVADAPGELRGILENNDRAYKRNNPMAVLNASDIGSAKDLRNKGATCWVKMSQVSVEGLRQAFLDPSSRVRLASDPVPDVHSEFLAMTWEGGFLDGAAVRFNENLNVLIGGRGTGKSTIVESIRYVLDLDPLGEESGKASHGIINNVLRDGTKVSLLIRSHHPALSEYLVERIVPNPPVVRTAAGGTSDLRPIDIIPGIEVYGQHEISELTKNPEKLTNLLNRFVETDPKTAGERTSLLAELKRSRQRILELESELVDIQGKLGGLPGLEEKLARFRDAGVEEQLRDRSDLVTEEQALKTATDRVNPFDAVVSDLRRRLPLDLSYFTTDAIKALPAGKTLSRLVPILEQLSTDLAAAATAMEEASQRARVGIADVRTTWQDRQTAVESAYAETLRKLQETKIEGAQFIALRKQVEELIPLTDRKAELTSELRDVGGKRRDLLTRWEDAKTSEFRRLDRAATHVSRRLKGKVRVRVAHAGNRQPLTLLLKNRTSGRLAESLEVLTKRRELSLPELADAIRTGATELETKFRIPSTQAQNLAQGGRSLAMEVEELELPPTTAIELNVGSSESDLVWQTLDDLSTGQKATAVLLLLLLESEAPLVVDQPEDDLDNRFITDGIVPKMRDEKRRRQFVFATHNANIPVLGDAELIAALSAMGEAGRGHADIPTDCEGSIDSATVRELVEELLEGGRAAFEMRRLKYGF